MSAQGNRPLSVTAVTPWRIETTPVREALKGHDWGGLHASILSEERDPSHEKEYHVRPFHGTNILVFRTLRRHRIDRQRSVAIG
jgi:hypothetical protein